MWFFHGRSTSLRWALVWALLLAQTVQSIQLDLDSDESIKKAAKQAASGMMAYYNGHQPGNIPGNLPEPYYWWEAGAMFGALVEYWYYTGDATYNEITTQALLHQTGPENNYMPPNQTRTLGNDDQTFWAFAAMSAAEVKFPNPPPDKPQWLALAQAVFHSQIPRWDNASCGGGLKWQVFPFNNGFTYKNTVSNGCFFNLAARLAVYTGRRNYAEWAERIWDWTVAVGLVDAEFHFRDGTDERSNCTVFNTLQWTYNAGLYLLGAAHMYQFTNNSPLWQSRMTQIIHNMGATFFSNANIMSEITCEPTHTCNTDQRSFKAYLARFMAHTMQIAPFTRPLLLPKLRASAAAAALQCSGPGGACGLRWTSGTVFDGSVGVGEQMAALEVFQGLLSERVPGRVTAGKGGISAGGGKGNGKEGGGGDGEDWDWDWDWDGDDGGGYGGAGKGGKPVTGADRFGAAVLTLLLVVVIVGGLCWGVS